MSRNSLLVIEIWLFLCITSLILWETTTHTQQEIFYIYYINLVQVVAPLITAFLAYHTMNVFDRGSHAYLAWGWLTLGLFAWTTGALLDALYTLLHQGTPPPFPWYSDIAYLMLNVFTFLTLTKMKTALAIPIPFWGWLGGLLVFTGTVSLGIWINLEELPNIDKLTLLVTLTYVILDPLLLATTIATATALEESQMESSPCWWILIGLFVFYLGDVINIFFQNAGMPTVGGVLIDLTWPVAFGLIALAATTAHSISTST